MDSLSATKQQVGITILESSESASSEEVLLDIFDTINDHHQADTYDDLKSCSLLLVHGVCLTKELASLLAEHGDNRYESFNQWIQIPKKQTNKDPVTRMQSTRPTSYASELAVDVSCQIAQDSSEVVMSSKDAESAVRIARRLVEKVRGIAEFSRRQLPRVFPVCGFAAWTADRSSRDTRATNSFDPLCAA